MNKKHVVGIVLVAVFVLLGAATAQNPRWPAIYFSSVGANDADISVVRLGEPATPELRTQLTTSDTDAVGILAGGFTFYEDFDAIIVEGATDDASEMTVEFADATADLTVNFRDDLADTYHPLTQPDGDVTGGVFQHPDNGQADAVTTTTDETMLCEVIYLPMWLTVANVYLRGVVGSDSASDDTISFAIYENADAGTQLTEATGADLSATANVTLDVTDVTLGPGMYRFCGCAQDVSGAAFHAATRDDESIDIMNLGAVTFGTAANVCVAGNPPTTTGALTTADDNAIVFKIGG